MTKDYVRKRPIRQGHVSKQLVMLLASFLSGYLTATVFDFTSLTTWVNKNILNSNTRPTEAKKSATYRAVKPKFEFYTLLAKDNSPSTLNHPAIASSKVSHQPPVAAQLPLIPPTNTVSLAANRSVKEAFLIQIAAFSKRQDAEHLKASLLLRGFDVTVSPFLKENVNWYRVVVGPFSSRAQALKAQVAVARSEHIKGMIRKIDV